MRYNPKSFAMLNRDMLRRDLFYFLALVVFFDVYVAVTYDGSAASTTLRLLAIIATVVVVIALILFFVLTKPKKIISNELIDSAERFEMFLPDDITAKETRSFLPAFSKDMLYNCDKGTPGFSAVCDALKNLKGARTKIEPDYPRLNLVLCTANEKELIESFHENVTFRGNIYRVPQKYLDATFFNDVFVSHFTAQAK